MPTRIIPANHIAAELVDLVNDSRESLYLVSPYLSLWTQLEQSIAIAARRGVKVHLVYRRDQRSKLLSVANTLSRQGITVRDVERLHAKVYVSESACLLTSMNLVESSALNNEEFAQWSNEPQLVTRSMQYAEQLLARSEDAKTAAPASKQWAPEPPRPPAPKGRPAPTKPGLLGSLGDWLDELMSRGDGTCIRCGEDVEYNPYRPLCRECYTSWARYKNLNYPENFCHDCGDEMRTSVAKPLCFECWQDN